MTDVQTLIRQKIDTLGEAIGETRELIAGNILSDKLTTLFTRTNETHADMLALVGMVVSSRDTGSSTERSSPDADWYLTIRRFVTSLTEALHEIAGDGEFSADFVHKVAHMADCLIESELEHGQPARRYATVLERDHWVRGRRQLVEELREKMAEDSYLADTSTPDVVSRMAYALIESDPPPVVVPPLGPKPDEARHAPNQYHIVTIADTLRAPRKHIASFDPESPSYAGRDGAVAEARLLADKAERGHRFMVICGPTWSDGRTVWSGGRNFAGQYWERGDDDEDMRPLIRYAFCMVGVHAEPGTFADHLREGGTCDPMHELVVKEFGAVASHSSFTLELLSDAMNRPANDNLWRAVQGTPLTVAVLSCREVLARETNGDLILPSEFDQASLTLIRAVKGEVADGTDGEQFVTCDAKKAIQMQVLDMPLAWLSLSWKRPLSPVHYAVGDQIACGKPIRDCMAFSRERRNVDCRRCLRATK